MLRTILVGLDGSMDSEAAVELGIFWSKKFGSLLVGMGVIDEPTFRGNQPVSQIRPSYKVAYDQLVSDARLQVEQFLQKFTLRCTEERVPHKLLEDVGQPDEQILTEAQRYDIVLLGRNVNFRFQTKRHDCETLEKVLRHACRPVVVVPEHPKHSNEVLVAFDGSIQAARTLQAFLNTGLHELGNVRIVCVHADSKVLAAKILNRAVEFLRFHDVEAEPFPIVSQSNPGEVFIEQAIQSDASLIVMGAFGQTRLREFLLGSATCTALKNSHIPLFLYH